MGRGMGSGEVRGDLFKERLAHEPAKRGIERFEGPHQRKGDVVPIDVEPRRDVRAGGGRREQSRYSLVTPVFHGGAKGRLDFGEKGQRRS